MAKLTNKQEMFCREYIIDLNASQAALRAGYSEKTAKDIGCENLAKPNISAFIAELIKERAERTEINADWVLRSAKQVFDRCMQVESVEGHDDDPMVQYKFEHSGANKALEIIGKHVNVQAFIDKKQVEVSLTDNFDDLLNDASD